MGSGWVGFRLKGRVRWRLEVPLLEAELIIARHEASLCELKRGFRLHADLVPVDVRVRVRAGPAVLGVPN